MIEIVCLNFQKQMFRRLFQIVVDPWFNWIRYIITSIECVQHINAKKSIFKLEGKVEIGG